MTFSSQDQLGDHGTIVVKRLTVSMFRIIGKGGIFDEYTAFGQIPLKLHNFLLQSCTELSKSRQARSDKQILADWRIFDKSVQYFKKEV